jgi:hypothetical protein
MKRKKKKYNPLKKYKHGGKHDEQPNTKPDPKSEKWDEKSSAAFDAYMAGMASAEKDAEPEDLMEGRTFIPRMSTAAKASLMAGAKELMDKIKAKKEEKKGKEEEEETSESDSMDGVEKSASLLEDRADRAGEMGSGMAGTSPLGLGRKGGFTTATLSDYPRKDKIEKKEDPEAEETVAKYGAKILKKYANGGEFDKFKMKKTVRKKNQEGVTSDAPISEAAQSEIDSQRVAGNRGRYTKTKKKRKDIPPTSMKKTVTERFPTSKKKTITKRSNR